MRLWILRIALLIGAIYLFRHGANGAGGFVLFVTALTFIP